MGITLDIDVTNLPDPERHDIEFAMLDSTAESISRLRAEGVSVSSVEEAGRADIRQIISFEGILTTGQAYAEEQEHDDHITPAGMIDRASLIERLGGLTNGGGTIFESPQTLALRSILPAAIERLNAMDDQYLTPDQVNQILTQTLQTELQQMDRNTNWNVNLGELNEYRTDHGLDALALPRVQRGGHDGIDF